MYRKSRAVTAAALVVACTACAKQTAGPVLTLTPMEAIWTASIQPTNQNSGQAAASRRTMINGEVSMVADKDYPLRTVVHITLGTPVTDASVSWALVPERCGTGGVPVLPVNAFSPIEVGPSGRGEVTAVIPFTLPTSGAYHINIYEAQRAELADVQACAQLTLRAK
ncbi:MAG: hypothetical protein ABI035_04815 [Gemmatimonadaceae bacterium]